MHPTFRVPTAIAVIAVFVVGCNPLSSSQTAGAGPTSTPARATPVASVPPTSVPPVSPDAQEAREPVAPVEVTGTFVCGPPVRDATEEALDVGDHGTVLTRNRDGAWQQRVSMTDPRLEGSVYHTWEADTYRTAGAADDGPTVTGYTWRITNDEGSWESRSTDATFADGTSIGEPPAVLVGAGSYDGLIAVLEVTEDEAIRPCGARLRGMIFDGAPMPEPYVAG